MATNFDALVDGAFSVNASDIHLVQDSPVFLRVDGRMRSIKNSMVTREEIDSFLERIMPEKSKGALEDNRGADFSWQPDDRMRFRVAAYFERDRLRLVMRLIKIKIMTLDELNLPPILKTIASYTRGLVLVTGVTGSGKSTTLAAMINHINSEVHRCIITIEDPIEMVHPNIRSLISQRDVGRDVMSFRNGLVQALRQDPDIILVGEMRDPETISTALRAAETGHFVFSTMHTTNAIHTLERILSEFPEEEHDLIREQIANNMRATITQRLVPRAGGSGRAAALEIMIVNAPIQKLLLENNLGGIGTIIRGRNEGMMLFDQHLADLVREEKITEEDAVEFAEDEFAFRRYMKGKLTSADRGGIIG